MHTGRSGMMASKAAIATTGHNISNANTEGFSRQRVETSNLTPQGSSGSHALVGSGTQISRVDRVNDEYVEKQIRSGAREMATMEERDMALRQSEDIFNEMNGDGLNRLISRFFNEFRKLSNEPDNEAVRQSVRESSSAMVNDFKRLRREVDEVRRNIDSRLEGYAKEVNSLVDEVRDLNIKIKAMEVGGAPPNDLLDKRDLALKKLGTYMELTTHKDGQGGYVVDIKGVGPLVVGGQTEKFSVFRSPADEDGKPEGAMELRTSASASSNITHRIKTGKFGALLDVRDNTLSTILDRLDDLAYAVTNSVNGIHEQGFTRFGSQGVSFFRNLNAKERAAEFMDLSDEIKASVNNIAAAAEQDAPGDNRVAIAISGIQSAKILSQGKSTMDDFYNSIVSDIGVATARNRSGMNQQRDVNTQLNKIRDQISGVSIDEETANLMQFQHMFDASAKVIQVADEMLKTVLELKR
ncbi:MAG: flagellar hook-associated protein FlgK [Bdellovibrionales bacterium GWC1_52_8]|nr:MAG: flagellar hook-associated protein FlgK [Bdellovibrionales bacterium GWA1_52_35]OFZ38579.1 MAG: flagellar hook-associated protein FlgK [Bdellovibrionales bacterium GWC1_52_8]